MEDESFRSLLFFMVMFLVLFVSNKDRFGSRRSRSSLLGADLCFFGCFFVGARFSMFFVLYNFI
jgi:hypothetical protein